MFRFIIYGLATFCLTLVYALRLAFHSTILCQYDPTSNSTEHYLTDPTYKVLSYSSVSFGLLIGLVPLSALYHLGTRKIFSIYGFIGYFSTFFYPLADSYGFFPAFLIRLLQGLPGAMYLWAVNSISLAWAPRSETGMAVAILSCFYQLSPVIASITSGEMCSSLGWEYTYYFLGALTAFCFLLFWFIYTDNPYENKFVTKEEAELISDGKASKDSHKNIPYSEMLSDFQVHLAWFLYASYFIGAYLFLQFGPVYISLVLNFNIRSTGYAIAFPHIISLFSKFAYGHILDKLCNFSQRMRLIIAYCSVELLSVSCLCFILFTHSESIALLVYILFNSLHSLAMVVIMRHMQLIARQHTHVLANGNSFIVAITVLGTSFLQYFVLNNSQEQWTVIFLGVASLIVVAIIVFVFFSISKPRKWTEIESIPLKE